MFRDTVLRPDDRHRGSARAGFSLFELLVASTLVFVVMAGVLGVLSAENRRLSVQKELGDTWLTLRSATELITYDLRQASATGGDLAAITDTSFTVRSRRGSAVICSNAQGSGGVLGILGLPWTSYALTGVTGEFTASTGDSVQVLTVGKSPVWKRLRVEAIGDPGTVGPASCVWAGSAPPATGIRLVVSAAADTARLAVGSAVQAFRSTRYGIMTFNNRRWLGRKVAGATSWELVAGPLRTDGLRLTYYTSAGAVTTVPGQVASVRLTLRGESYGRTNLRSAARDTLSVRIQLRN